MIKLVVVITKLAATATLLEWRDFAPTEADIKEEEFLIVCLESELHKRTFSWNSRIMTDRPVSAYSPSGIVQQPTLRDL